MWSHVIRPTEQPRDTLHRGVTDVLIVDGDTLSLDLLQRALRGYRVATALSGVDGVMHARRCRPAVVVADERLPRLSGSDVIETIRQQWPDAHAVLLTRLEPGISEDMVIDRRVHALPKQAAVRELRPLITTLIGLPRGTRRLR